MNQSKLEANTCSRHKARENVREQVAISLGFTSDWLRKWRESFKPITECSNAKPKQTRITFDTQVKIALFRSVSANITLKLCFEVENCKVSHQRVTKAANVKKVVCKQGFR